MRLAIFLRTIFAMLLFLSVECETMHTAYGKVVEKQTARSQGNVAGGCGTGQTGRAETDPSLCQNFRRGRLHHRLG